MKNNYFGEKVRKARSSERGEAMPAAIVTAIVSSLILLGIASVVSMVIQNKADSEGNVTLTTAVSNIDVSLRSDINQASYITAAAKLKQPTARLLTPTDVTLSGVNMHVPVITSTPTGNVEQCKVIRWNINGSIASRELTIYKSSLKTDVSVKCDETSPIVAQRTKVFAENVNVDAPFKFNNQVGRELAFTIEDASLTKVNASLDSQLNTQGVAKLNDTEFNNLNKLMGTSSYVVGFKNPAACVMDAAKVWVDANNDGIKQTTEMVCPPAEADTVAAAWNSLRIAKVSVAFQMQADSGEVAKRDIAQNSSVPLYADAAEAEASVADSSADNRPIAPSVSLTTSNVVLGANYTINWTAGGTCPTDMVRSYKVYENDVLVKTQSTQGYTKNYTNSATQFLNYNVQIECVRGALVVASDMSAVATAKVIPAVPALVINTQPAVTDAPLNSNLTSTATCLYGTVAHYNVRQVLSTFGSAGTAVLNVASVNRAINNGFPVVEGARYQYQVEAWCESAFDKSTLTNTNTAPFTTVINIPTVGTPVFTSPADGATNVATNATVSWSASACAAGTTVQYYTTKNINNGATITAQVIDNWTSGNTLATNNNEGSTVGYTVAARCAGTAVNSASSATDTVKYTTLVSVPDVPVFTSPTNGDTDVSLTKSVQWSGVGTTCASGTVPRYYMRQNKDEGVSITSIVLRNWTSDLAYVTSNTEGNKVGYAVQARCEGPNAVSAPTAASFITYTTLINAPSPSNFTSPSDGAVNVSVTKSLQWSGVGTTCGAGTVPRYYVVQTMADGVAIAPVVLVNWASDLAYSTSNNEGTKVGYAVQARCEGPNAVSSPAVTDTITFTTLVNAPAGPVFTSPAEGATNVATNATVSWSSVTCGPGAAPKYYSNKYIDKNANITPIVYDNWTADTSLVSANKQGYTVGYAVAARCEGANANSGASPTDTVKYTTKVNAPSAVTAGNNGWGNVTWSAPATGCAAEAPIAYRVHQTKSDNNAVNYYASWTTGLTATLPGANTGGYPQWADVQAYCNGVNADSTVTAGANTTKWVKLFDVSFSASQSWRRVNVWGSCPVSTTVDSFNLYVAADGWGGVRGAYGWIATDEGAHIADAQPGPGGNTGWMNLMQNVNAGWNDTRAANTTYNWGYWGAGGLGAYYTSSNISATYWNASGWGAWAYWWTGSCETPYMVVYDKGTAWVGGAISNAGSPGTRYNGWLTRGSLKQAGVDAIK